MKLLPKPNHDNEKTTNDLVDLLPTSSISIATTISSPFLEDDGAGGRYRAGSYAIVNGLLLLTFLPDHCVHLPLGY